MVFIFIKLYPFGWSSARWASWAGSLLAICFGVRPGSAAHPLATDDAATLEPGSVEVELAALTAGPAGTSAVHVEESLALHWGPVSRIQLGGRLGYEQHHEVGRWTLDMSLPMLDLKGLLRESDPGIALRLDYRAPRRGADGFTGHDVGSVMIASVVGDALEAHFNIGGYALGLRTSENRAVGFASATVLAAVADAKRLGLEAVAEEVTPQGMSALTWLTAFMWQLDPGTLSVGGGATWIPNDSVGWVTTLGFTSGFARKRPEQDWTEAPRRRKVL
jgi:hypothetical protein